MWCLIPRVAAANTFLVNYAKHGNPNGAGLPIWKRLYEQTQLLMDFSATSSPVGGRNPWTEQLDLVEKTQSGAL